MILWTPSILPPHPSSIPTHSPLAQRVLELIRQEGEGGGNSLGGTSYINRNPVCHRNSRNTISNDVQQGREFLSDATHNVFKSPSCVEMNSLPNIHGFHSRNEGYPMSNRNSYEHSSASNVTSDDGTSFNFPPWPNMLNQHRGQFSTDVTSQPRTAHGLRESGIGRMEFCNNFLQPFTGVRENDTESGKTYNLSPDMEFDDMVIYSQPFKKAVENNMNIVNPTKNVHIKVPFTVKNGLNFKETKPRPSQNGGFKTNTISPCLKPINYSSRMLISSKIEPSDQTFVFTSTNTVPKYKKTLENFKSIPSRKSNAKKSLAQNSCNYNKDIVHLNVHRQNNHRKRTFSEATSGKVHVHENSSQSSICKEKENFQINDVFDESFENTLSVVDIDKNNRKILMENKPNSQKVKTNVKKVITAQNSPTHLSKHSEVYTKDNPKTIDLKVNSNCRDGVSSNSSSGNNTNFDQQSELTLSLFVKTQENKLNESCDSRVNEVVDKNQFKTTCQQNENQISDLSQNIFVRTQESVGTLNPECCENMVNEVYDKAQSEELSLPPYQKPVEYESPDFDVDDLFSLKDEHLRESLSTLKGKNVNSETFLNCGNEKGGSLPSKRNRTENSHQVILETFEESKDLNQNGSHLKMKIERDPPLRKNESEKINTAHPIKSKYFQASLRAESSTSEIPVNVNKINKNSGKSWNKGSLNKGLVNKGSLNKGSVNKGSLNKGSVNIGDKVTQNDTAGMDVDRKNVTEVNIVDNGNSDEKSLITAKPLKQSTLLDCRGFQHEMKTEPQTSETLSKGDRFKKPLPPAKKAKTIKNRSANQTGENPSPVHSQSHLKKSENVFLQSNTSMHDIKQKCDPSRLVQPNLFKKEPVNKSMNSMAQQKRNKKPGFVPPLASSHLTSQEITLKNYTVTVIDDVTSDQVLQRLDSEELTKVVTSVAFKEGYTLLNKPGDQKKNSRCFPSGVMFMVVWGTGKFGFYWLPLLDHSSITPSVTKLIDKLMSKFERNVCFEAQAVYMLLMDVLKYKDISNWNAYDPLIGSWLLDPDNPPKDFQETSEKLQMDRNLLVVNPQANTRNQACDLLQVLDTAMNILQNRLVNASLWTVFTDMETKLIPILAAMESSSILVDVDKLHQTADAMDKRLRKLQSEAHTLADRWFQLNSPQQLREILFDQLKLDEKFNLKIKKTDQGVKSTSETVLEQIKEYHPLPKIILEYRRLQKLKSTYVDGLIQHVKSDGTIGTSWEQVSAATGRITSKNPNLQAVPKSPISVQDGEMIYLREMFKARDGCSFLGADFQQIEFRVFAHFTQDKSLLQAFREGGDIFQRLAERWLGGKAEEEREKTKRIVYSVMYGAGANKLSEYLHVEPSEAYKIIDNFIAIFPSLRSLPKTVIAQCRAQGFVATLSGRRRLFPHIRSTNGKLRSYSERQAMNFLIQGSAADICKAAMLDCEAEIRSRGLRAKLLLMIHDELIWEVDERDLVETSKTVREAMEHRWNERLTLMVPIPVCVSVGKTLANMESLVE